MGGMPMPGGWVMSMTWMRMPGQTWPGAAASFLVMWTVMMIVMMLPALVPMLRDYHRSIGRASAGAAGRLTAIAALGYFAVWAAAGMVIYPFGLLIAALAMDHPAFSRAVPPVGALAIVGASLLQTTAWKVRRLECCRRMAAAAALPGRTSTAWRHGLRLGVECTLCCANLMSVLLACGLMDLRAMFGVMIAIGIERLLPPDPRVARATGIPIMATGLWLTIGSP